MPRPTRGGRSYNIDDRGVAVPASALPSPSQPSVTDDTPRIGRSVVVGRGSNRFLTVLDWRSEDEKARAVRVIVGLARNDLSFEVRANYPNAGQSTVFYPFESSISFANRVGSIVRPGHLFRVEFGVEGYSDQIVMDANPAQSLTLVASFIRITAMNGINDAAILPAGDTGERTFEACVIPDNGYPSAPVRLTQLVVADPAHPGVSINVPVPRFSKRVRISRTHDTGGPNLDLNVFGVGCSYDTIPDPGVDREFSVTYDIFNSNVIGLIFPGTSNASAAVQFDIQP